MVGKHEQGCSDARMPGARHTGGGVLCGWKILRFGERGWHDPIMGCAKWERTASSADPEKVNPERGRYGGRRDHRHLGIPLPESDFSVEHPHEQKGARHWSPLARK